MLVSYGYVTQQPGYDADTILLANKTKKIIKGLFCMQRNTKRPYKIITVCLITHFFKQKIYKYFNYH